MAVVRSVDVEPDGPGSVTVVLAGVLDFKSRSEVEEAFAPAFPPECRHLVIDMSQVEYVNEGGVQSLVLAVQRLRDTGCDVVLRAPSDAVRRRLDVTGLGPVLRVED